MRLLIRYKTEKGGHAFVRCKCCGSRRVFRSWSAARGYIATNGIKAYVIIRVGKS